MDELYVYIKKCEIHGYIYFLILYKMEHKLSLLHSYYFSKHMVYILE